MDPLEHAGGLGIPVRASSGLPFRGMEGFGLTRLGRSFPRGLGLPGLFKQHRPRVWGLPGIYQQPLPMALGFPGFLQTMHLEHFGTFLEQFRFHATGEPRDGSKTAQVGPT